MELTRAQAVQVFLQGYHRACWFLKGAGYFIDNREHALGGFLLHQSAEQCLRTLVLVVRGEEVKTHCLKELKQHLKKYAVSSHELFGEGGEREQHLWERLERAYSCSRYTGCYALEAATARELLQLVRRLLEGIKKMFWELLEKYSGNEVSIYK
jgi:HEPN domain-containing protein